MAKRAQLHSLVPLVQVGSVPRSIEFYAKLGLSVANVHTPEGGTEPVWAWLDGGGAHLMISLAREAVDPTRQAALFYLYVRDVAAFRAKLLDEGVPAGAVEYPFWAPRGEFRIEDPDGYVLMISHV